MSERPPREAGNQDVEAIMLNDREKQLWLGLARILEEPISVCWRLCALSGAEHYLAEMGQMEQAAMAGALLRLFAESRGIEVHAREPSTREVHMGRKKRSS